MVSFGKKRLVKADSFTRLMDLQKTGYSYSYSLRGAVIDSNIRDALHTCTGIAVGKEEEDSAFEAFVCNSASCDIFDLLEHSHVPSEQLSISPDTTSKAS